jgi:argininosuccinate synthase
MSYAQKYDIPVTATLAKPYSIDRNLMHCSFEGGILEDPWRAPDEEMFLLSQAPELAPDEPEELILGFEGGDPVALDGDVLSPAALLGRLNRIAGTHGVGRVDLVENRFVGLKSRGVYETPGGTVLHAAHRALESITLDREVLHDKQQLALRFAELIYNGFWFSPEMDVVRAALDASQQRVSGEVRVKLYKGAVHVSGRRSPHSLYSEELVTFEEDQGAYDQVDAGGFIRLQALRLAGDRSRD